MKSFTWTEIEAAYDEAHQENVMQGKAALKAKLFPKTMRDDCPVMYDDGRGCRHLEYGPPLGSDATNIRALILEDVIIQKAKERDEYLKQFGGHRIHSDESYWANVIDVYKFGAG